MQVNSTRSPRRRRIARFGSRLGRFEPLESRRLLAFDFLNDFHPCDVDDDGYLTPLDALLVINDLNSNGSRDLADSADRPAFFVDVNGDRQLTPQDGLAIVNQLNAPVDGSATPFALATSLSPDSDPDGNGVVLSSSITLLGQTDAHAWVRVRGDADSEWIVQAAADGRFQFTLDLPAGASTWSVEATDRQRPVVQESLTIRLGDTVVDWNATLLNVIRDWTTLSNDPYPNRVVTERPPVAARNLAMVHAAMYDAVNSIERSHEPYYADLPAAPGASPIAAAAAAAHRVASSLYKAPDEIAAFDAALAESLAQVPDEGARTSGIDLGQRVGDAILNLRRNDGASRQVSYTPGTDPGEWQRTFPDYLPPLLPQWPQVTPFALTSGTQFRPAPPPTLDSAEYAANVDEVQRLGGLNSIERSSEQTEIALFWADGGGTFTPPGHWNQIATDVALQLGGTLAENARLLALLNLGLADAGITAWDAKYTYELWRPIDAIRRADTDGNAATQVDPTWTPLLKTPPFPTYTSGHSTFSGAAAAILTAVVGDHFAFSSRADAHASFRQKPLNESLVPTRSFPSFQAAADEAGRSRIYGGIHFEFDNQAGLASGRAIGQYVVENFLRVR